LVEKGLMTEDDDGDWGNVEEVGKYGVVGE
jgi:hypothetical protein